MLKITNNFRNLIWHALLTQLFFVLLFFVFFISYHIILKEEPFWKVFYIPKIYNQSLILFHFYGALFFFVNLFNYRFFRLLFSLLILLIMAIYGLQLYSYYFAGTFLFPAALSQIEAVSIYFSIGNFVYVFILFLLLVVLFEVIGNYVARKCVKSLMAVPITVAVIILINLLLFSGYFLTQKITGEFAIKHRQKPLSPEISFVITLLDFFDKKIVELPYFTSEEIQVLSSHGLIVDTTRIYPFQKDEFYSQKLSFPKKAVVKNKNLIVFFVESLSSRFLGCHQSQFVGLTPNIDSIAMQSLVAHGYINHTTPTVNGLKGQLFSLYPTNNNSDYEGSRPDFAKNFGLPYYLNKKGYHTSILSYEEKGAIINTSVIFMDAGFEEILSKEPLRKKFNLKSTDYLNDEEMVTATIGNLSELQKSEKPFFLSVTTVGTHVGNSLPPNCKKYPDVDLDVLHLVHNLDNQLGRFWEYFKTSGLILNTTFVITADHSYYPNPELNKVLNDKIMHYVDSIPLIIYDPEYSLPSHYQANSSSVSFSPTMMHLMNVENQRNAFIGYSVFEKNRMPFVFGECNNSVVQYENGHIIPIDPELQLLILRWLKWQNYMIVNNRMLE